MLGGEWIRSQTDVGRDQTQRDPLGCGHCWPDDAQVAWDRRVDLERLHVLCDESHYIVKVLACMRCGQRYVSIFTETIDWSDGDDAQYWALLPITEAEAASIAQSQTLPDEVFLGALGSGRRCLRRDHPTGGPVHVYWGCGTGDLQHD